MDMFELVLNRIMEHSQPIYMLEICFDKIELKGTEVFRS